MGLCSFMNAYNNLFGLAANQGAGLGAGPDLLRNSVSSIVRCVLFMKRIFSHSVFAFAAGLCLRLFFVFRYPVNSSGDTVLYEQMATNWLKRHVYAMNVNGAISPVDLRMPGYPAFLALIYALTGRTGPDARFYVMMGQVAVDLCACLITASLAALLLAMKLDSGSWKRVFIVTLWIAALCPFTANYTAVP